jgi:serine/threonine protein kinase
MTGANKESLVALEEVFKNGFISEYEYYQRRAELDEENGTPTPHVGITKNYSNLKMNDKLQILEELLNPLDPIIKPSLSSTVEGELGIPSLDSFWQIPSSEIFLEDKIGKGYFSTVYRASYHGLKVAVKHVILQNINRKEMISINREILFLKHFRHPHIISFLGIINDSRDDVKIVMEFAENGDLREYLKNSRNQISWPNSIQIAIDISCAMAYLHSRKIIFRDLKGRNVLLDKQLRAKLCDLGLARLSSESSVTPYLNKSGDNKKLSICVGTPAFMAPEMILQLPYDHKVDVFSFGLVLLELVTRKKIGTDIMRNHDYGIDIEWKNLIPKDCPEAFYKLGAICCDSSPENRPEFDNILSMLFQIQNCGGDAVITEIDDLFQQRTTVSSPKKKTTQQNQKNNTLVGGELTDYSPKTPQKSTTNTQFTIQSTKTFPTKTTTAAAKNGRRKKR